MPPPMRPGSGQSDHQAGAGASAVNSQLTGLAGSLGTIAEIARANSSHYRRAGEGAERLAHGLNDARKEILHDLKDIFTGLAVLGMSARRHGELVGKLNTVQTRQLQLAKARPPGGGGGPGVPTASRLVTGTPIGRHPLQAQRFMPVKTPAFVTPQGRALLKQAPFLTPFSMAHHGGAENVAWHKKLEAIRSMSAFVGASKAGDVAKRHFDLQDRPKSNVLWGKWKPGTSPGEQEKNVVRLIPKVFRDPPKPAQSQGSFLQRANEWLKKPGRLWSSQIDDPALAGRGAGAGSARHKVGTAGPQKAANRSGGGMGGGLVGGLGGAAVGLGLFTAGVGLATSVAVGWASVVGAMMQAASPNVWRTFTGSIELLMATVGVQLVPTFVELTVFVSNLTASFNKLDGATKQHIGNLLGARPAFHALNQVADGIRPSLFKAQDPNASAGDRVGAGAKALLGFQTSFHQFAVGTAANALPPGLRQRLGLNAFSDAGKGSKLNGPGPPIDLNTAQPRITGIEQVWENMALGFLSETELQRRLMELNTQALQELAKRLDEAGQREGGAPGARSNVGGFSGGASR